MYVDNRNSVFLKKTHKKKSPMENNARGIQSKNTFIDGSRNTRVDKLSRLSVLIKVEFYSNDDLVEISNKQKKKFEIQNQLKVSKA